MSAIIHTPVMVKEILDYLQPQPDGVYVDCTVGTGGHTVALLKNAPPGVSVVGIDRDTEALATARGRLHQFSNRYRLVKSNFTGIDDVLNTLKIKSIQGLLYDLGVSSLQFDEQERGFTLHGTSQLDMRMDQQQSLTAADILSSASMSELEHIFLTYGEERWARRMAEFIVRERDEGSILSADQLVDTLKRAVPAHFRRGKKYHFATRVFQALRIAVNDELSNLETALPAGVKRLAPGARLCVLSYHSLEDRIVKNYFRKAEGCELRILTKRVLRPSPEEMRENPRSRSAKLRVAEKICHD